MVKFEFIADDTGTTTVLSDSTRSLAEHNIKLNHQRALQIEEMFAAAYKFSADQKNQRNRISFDVYRSKNTAGTEFVDPEAAFVFALDHLQADAGLGASGTLKMTFQGAITAQTRYLHKALLEVCDLVDASTGVSIGLSYTFNGAQIDSSPT